LQRALAGRDTDPVAKRSLELKVAKALQSKQRLQDEEALMLAEARRRHAADPRPAADSLVLAPASEIYRQDLADALAELPYLRIVKVGRATGRWDHNLL
jgi:hypothetical protein